jgi:hypothetical protein
MNFGTLLLVQLIHMMFEAFFLFCITHSLIWNECIAQALCHYGLLRADHMPIQALANCLLLTLMAAAHSMPILMGTR